MIPVPTNADPASSSLMCALQPAKPAAAGLVPRKLVFAVHPNENNAAPHVVTPVFPPPPVNDVVHVPCEHELKSCKNNVASVKLVQACPATADAIVTLAPQIPGVLFTVKLAGAVSVHACDTSCVTTATTAIIVNIVFFICLILLIGFYFTGIHYPFNNALICDFIA